MDLQSRGKILILLSLVLTLLLNLVLRWFR